MNLLHVNAFFITFDDPIKIIPAAEPQSTSSDWPTLLHLVQPYALENLRNLLKHVERLRSYIGGLYPNIKNSQLAKDTLVDLVDTSGIDLVALDLLLTDFRPEVQAISGKSLFKISLD